MFLAATVALFVSGTGTPAWAALDSGIAAYDAGEFAVAYRELMPLAARQNPTAAYILSRMYFAGQGVNRNPEEGMKWLKIAADKGEAEAEVQLGLRYENGIGLAQSDAEAFRWYRQAAVKGSPVAQLYLGTMYGSGRGVALDLLQAHLWLNLATANLPPGQIRNSAAKLRDSITLRLTPEQVEKAHALARNWKPGTAEETP